VSATRVYPTGAAAMESTKSVNAALYARKGWAFPIRFLRNPLFAGLMPGVIDEADFVGDNLPWASVPPFRGHKGNRCHQGQDESVFDRSHRIPPRFGFSFLATGSMLNPVGKSVHGAGVNWYEAI